MTTQNTIIGFTVTLYSHADDIIWTPTETLYIYDGDLYCKPCGMAIQGQLLDETCDCSGCDCGIECKPECASNIPASQGYHDDSNSWPQEYPRGEGESDTPDHCGKCQRFLGRNLTDDGIAYVKEKARELAFMALPEHHCTLPSYKIVKGWCDFYGIELKN